MAITVFDVLARMRATGADEVVSEFKKGQNAGDSFSKSARKWGKDISGYGQKATLGLTAPILGFTAFAIKQASDLNESQSAVRTAFGKTSDQIISSSKAAAGAVGLSSQAYDQAAANLSAFGKNAGYSGQKLVDFTQKNIQAAGDLASYWNTSTDDALSAIRSGLVGEAEPLKRYGIMLSQANVENYALAKGIWNGVGAMNDQQLMAARSGYIMSALGDAQGDFARTSGGLANQTRILKAEFQNFAATLGAILLPTVLQIVTVLRKAIDVFANMPTGVQKVAVIFGLLVAAIGPLLLAFGSILSAVGAIGVAFGAGGFAAPLLGLLGPIGLIVGALVLFGIAYKTNFLGFGDAVRSVASAISGVFVGAAKGFMDIVHGITREFELLRKGATNVQAIFYPMGTAVSQVTKPLTVFRAVLGTIGFAIKKFTGYDVTSYLMKFGDAVDAVADRIRLFVHIFQVMRDAGFNPFSAALMGLRSVLTTINFGPFQGLADIVISGLAGASRAMQKFTDRFSKGFAQLIAGFKKLKSAFAAGGLRELFGSLFGDGGALIMRGIGGMISAVPRAIGDFMRSIHTGFKPLDFFLHDIGRMFQDVGHIIADIFRGDWSKALDEATKLFSQWKATLRQELALILAVFHEIPWGTIWDALKTALSALGGLVVDAFNAVPWGAIWDLLKAGVSSAMDFLTGIDWGNVASTIWDGITGAVSSVPWGSIGDFIVGAASALLGVGSDLLQGVLDGWDALKPTLEGYASGLVDWISGNITNAPGALLEVGKALLQSVLDGWDFLKDKLGGYASGLIGWVVGLVTGGGGAGAGDGTGGPGGGLSSVGSGLIQSLLDGWDALKATLSGYASGLIGWIKGLVNVDPTALLDCGKAIIQSLLDGWDSLKGTLSGYASGLVSFITNLVSGCDIAFLDKGAELLQGLLDGWDSIKPTLTSYASGLLDWIVGLIPKADVLLKIGADVLQGFVDGWNSVKDALTTAVNVVTDLINGAKTAIDLTASAFTTGANGITSAISTITGVLSGPLSTVKGTIDDIYSAWQKLPGWLGGGGGGSGPTTPDKPIFGPAVPANLTPGPTPDAGQAGASLIGLNSAASTAATNLSATLLTMTTAIQTFVTDVGIKATAAGDAFNENSYVGFRAGQDSLDNVLAYMDTALGTFVSAVGLFATVTGNDFNTNIYVGLRAGQDTLDNVLLYMNTALGMFVRSVGTFATTAGNDFNTKSYAGFRAGQNSLDNVLSYMSRALGTFVSAVGMFSSTAGNDFNTKLYAGLRNGQNSLDNVLAHMAGSLGSMVGWAGSDAYSVGYAIGQGINNGISTWTSAIAATASAAVSNAIQAAKNAALVRSPSKRTIEIGEAMGEGFIVGLSRKAAGFETATKSFGMPDVRAPITAPVGSPSTSSTGGHHTFIVMTRSELSKFFEASEYVEVVTSPEEIRAAWGTA